MSFHCSPRAVLRPLAKQAASAYPHRVRLLPLVLLAVLAAGSALGYERSGSPVSPTLQITEVWVRATPPGADVGAAYATIINGSNDAMTVSTVTSDVAEAAQIHEMVVRDGVMRMRALDKGLRIDANSTTRLEPGGRHLMLFGLHRPLNAGDQVQLTFELSDGGHVSVAAPVRDTTS